MKQSISLSTMLVQALKENEGKIIVAHLVYHVKATSGSALLAAIANGELELMTSYEAKNFTITDRILLGFFEGKVHLLKELKYDSVMG